MEQKIKIDRKRLKACVLTSGGHRSPNDGLCLMETVAWVTHGDHTDFPPCAPLEISKLGQLLNDCDWDSDEQRTEALRPLIPLILKASHDPRARTKRGYLAAHFAMQQAAYAMDSAKLPEYAARLRAIPLPSSREECLAACKVAHEAAAAYAAYAAYDAAYAYADAVHAYADAAAAYAADAADAIRRKAKREALLSLMRAFCEVVP
jgi:hypothetical protein